MNLEADKLYDELFNCAGPLGGARALAKIKLALQRAFNKGHNAGERMEHDYPRNEDMTGR